MKLQVLEPLYWDRALSAEPAIDSEIFARACTIGSLGMMDAIISQVGASRVRELYSIIYPRLDARSQNFWNICFDIDMPLAPTPPIDAPIFDRIIR